MSIEDKYTAVDDEFLEEVLDLIEERDLKDELTEEEKEKLKDYKSLTNDN